MYLVVPMNLGLCNTIPLFSVAGVYDPGCLLVRIVVPAVFSRSLSLILGLCHHNPNQPCGELDEQGLNRNLAIS